MSERPARAPDRQAVGTKYQTTCEDAWNDNAGWSCLRFCMDAPMWFQYALVSDGQSFHATAHAQRRNFAGQIVDVTMVLRGALDPRTHEFTIAPNLEETWKVMP